MRADGDAPTGYRHPGYAASLSEFGTPLPLPRSGGWLLERSIPGAGHRDAMGCYPMFSCGDWARLRPDIDDLGDRLVSVVLVADPFGDCSPADLRECFTDLVVPFKEHFVVDLGRRPESYLSDHHRRNHARSAKAVRVDLCDPPAEYLDEWTGLYATLIERRAVSGIRAFSRPSFARQLAVPGIVAFRAVSDGALVGMLLWYVQGSVAYYHLGAYSEAGYRLGASFALFWRAISHFAALGLEWLDLGAGAGRTSDDQDGLTRFKRGWATGTRTAYLCGRILDRERYQSLTHARRLTGTGWFPAYRSNEFA